MFYFVLYDFFSRYSWSQTSNQVRDDYFGFREAAEDEMKSWKIFSRGRNFKQSQSKVLVKAYCVWHGRKPRKG